ncbi:MAG: DNA-binding protein [Sulfobacillus acidophilus]|uniref:DNA-binding protein n=1 Tax=Sulfobacillus acidophilus TaxID=53633 RepID=A0A2T2WL10_9FIRM|nr:MAG: DNA-binding protein [Sulfobacillus acidophilus]
MVVQRDDLLVLGVDWHVHYDHSAGEIVSAFLKGLGNGVIQGRHCPLCGAVWLPPRAYCERCFVATDQWVSVGPGGVLEAFTIVGQKFDNLPEPPYVIAFARLDGSDSSLANFLTMTLGSVEEMAERLAVGQRIRAEFKPESQRQLRITDFHYVLA